MNDKQTLIEFGDRLTAHERTRLIERIQLDAIKEGMRRAAKLNVLLANDYNEYLQTDAPIECNADDFNAKFEQHQQAILSVAEQLTNKDL